MSNTIFAGLFDSALTSVISPQAFLICMGSALVTGLILALIYRYRNRTTKSFTATLLLLPAIVSVVIMLVNGNIGAGVAVAGTFSLIRFRSQPGTGKEIAALFLATGSGMLCGMGYIAYAVLFTVLLGAVLLAVNSRKRGKKEERYRTLRITIPEDLDYTEVFAPLLGEYTSECELAQVKTTNLGSLFRLTYDITLKKDASEKEMIDALRVRNGNLEISVSRQMPEAQEL